MIDQDILVARMVKGLRDGAVELPPDVTQKIIEAFEKEENKMAKMQLKDNLDNI